MNYKEETKKLLILLKNEGVNRRKIEIDLHKGEFFIDSTLHAGSNETFYNQLKVYYETKAYLKSVITPEGVLLSTLLKEFAELKTKHFPEKKSDGEVKKVTDVIAEIQNKAEKAFDALNGKKN